MPSKVDSYVLPRSAFVSGITVLLRGGGDLLPLYRYLTESGNAQVWFLISNGAYPQAILSSARLVTGHSPPGEALYPTGIVIDNGDPVRITRILRAERLIKPDRVVLYTTDLAEGRAMEQILRASGVGDLIDAKAAPTITDDDFLQVLRFSRLLGGR